MRQVKIVLAVTLLLVSCGTPPAEPDQRGATAATERTGTRLPRDITYEDAGAPVFREIWIESSNLDIHSKQGPGITLAVDATFNNTSDAEVRPACWLEFGSQIRLLEVEETPVVPPNSHFSLRGLVRFPSRLDANESGLVYCRPLREDEIAPEDE